MMIRSDWHIHSEASYDASLTLEEIAQGAQKFGFESIGITDHANFNDDQFLQDLRRSAESVTEFQKNHSNVILGVELTPIEKPEFDYIQKNGTREGTGTSFACPLVAAAAALSKSVDKDITPSEFDAFLRQSADSSYITQSQGSDWWGSGLLNVEGLLRLVLQNKGYDSFYLSDIDVDDTGNSNVVLTNLDDSRFTGYSVYLS